jgi:ABC-type multidrug transport system fused ATPase/permease subunit
MQNWYYYLKQGLTRKKLKDRMAAKANPEVILPFFRRYWATFMAGLFIVLLATSFGYLLPLVQRFLIDKVIVGKQLALLIPAVSILAACTLLSSLLGIFQQFYFQRFGQKMIVDIQADLFKRVLRFPKSFFDDKETGYLMSRLSSDVQGLGWFFSSTSAYVLASVFRFLAGASLLFYLEWRLALAVLVVLPLLAAGVYYFSGKTRALGHHTMEKRADVMRRLQESLASIPLLKAFVSEEREAARLKKELNASYDISMEQTVVNSFGQFLIDSLSGVAKLVVLIAGIPLVVAGNFTIGSLFAFFTYLDFVFNPIQYLTSVNFQLQNALAALERISVFYDILPEEHGQGIMVDRLRGEIGFRQVSFSYNGEGAVLEDVTFSIKAGEHIAVIGQSGVGKTTLINLMLVFYRPTGGEIYFDGKKVDEYALDALRRRIGYVAQETRLLSGTIMDNLCYGNPDAGREEVERAARLAGIHSFIEHLANGYDSRVGENGVNLSEGQKQRISIARALIKDPDILIMDEPSSALDKETESSIFDLLPAAVKGKTMVVVAHRLSTIRAADRVLVFKDGRLAEEKLPD